MAARFVPFRPALEGVFADRFYRTIRHCIEANLVAGWKTFSPIANDEVAWSTSEGDVNPIQDAVFRACWLLLRDLQSIGWQLHCRSNTLLLAKTEMAAVPNSPEEISSQKQAIQDAMAFARL